jgi:hypothetical protein
MSAVSLITRKTAVVAILLVIVVLFAELKFGRLDEVFPLIVGLLLAGNIIYYWFKKRSS